MMLDESSRWNFSLIPPDGHLENDYRHHVQSNRRTNDIAGSVKNERAPITHYKDYRKTQTPYSKQ